MYSVLSASNLYTIHKMNMDGTNNTVVGATAFSNFNPTMDGAKTTLVYETDRNPFVQVYKSALNGSSEAHLASSSSDDDQPVISLDGSKIVFRSGRNGTPGIFLMNSDGSGITQVASGFVEAPSLSANGSLVLYSSTNSGPAQIFRVNADGSGTVSLSNNLNVDDFDPAYNHTGTKICFVRIEQATVARLWVMNADGTGQAKVVDLGGPVQSPSFSPDGTRIIFMYDDGTGWDICSVKTDGTGFLRLTSTIGVDEFKTNGFVSP
ncbi:MAG: PD40 domain-containing protein [Fimbriimonadaceae bacterium]|nr:PD40 domain-containing protein [Fimbriimonadaceae bacterium]